MARPQVADGGTASDMDGSCEYIDQAVADSRQGVVLQFEGGGGVGRDANKTPPREKNQMLRNIHRRDAAPGDKTIRR
jgi:hypothetical protein